MLKQLLKELDIANEKAARLRDTLKEVETLLSMRVCPSEGGKRIAQYLWGFEDVCKQTASKESLRNLIAACVKKGYISPTVAEGMLKCLDEKEKPVGVANCDPHIWDKARLNSFWRQSPQKEKPPEGGSETPAFDAAIRFAQAMFKAPD